MPLPFNFERSDEQFIAKMCAAQDRDLTILRLLSARAWVFWMTWLVLILSISSFMLSCLATKPSYQDALQAFIIPLLGFISFGTIDMQVKTLKLARQYERGNLSDSP